ncbi:MAG: nitroreductase family protein [Solidesulfovibrio sp. DCME]|uniref:nitroreductase family protein n=1 Tax=Solidesulfovibrio sp. DCME TaxID=3447380 RepID=UPI003D0CEF36
MAAAGRCGLMGCASRSQSAFMKSRRSVRVFADRVVSMRVLRDLVAAASWAQPGDAPGQARFVMVESEPAMDRMSDLAAGWLRREGILVDGLGPEGKAREVVFGGAPHMAVAFGPRDEAAAAACSLAVARMEWLALGAGLGVCFAGEMVQAAAGCPELAAALAIPDAAMVHAAVFIGYPGSRTARPEAMPGTRIIWL